MLDSSHTNVDRKPPTSGPNAFAQCGGGCATGRRRAGITLLAHWNVRENLRDGTLVRLELDDASAGDHTIWVVYPSAKLVLPKVRMFIAELETLLAGDYPVRR